MQKHTWDVNKLLAWAIDYFKTKEIPSPRLSAELLLSAVLNLSRMELYLKYNYELNNEQLRKYKEFILRRLKHEPIQYITGEAYFRKIKLHVDKNVLIPRPETELLVEKAKQVISDMQSSKPVASLAGNQVNSVKHTDIKTAKMQDIKLISSPAQSNTGIHKPEIFKSESAAIQSGRIVNILEIGTGSGAIAISLVHETNFNEDGSFPFNVVATDISKGAIETAKKNAGSILDPEKNNHLNFFECDVIPENSEEFVNRYCRNIDLVISNPPYISEADYENLDREIKDYEPGSALIAGKSGTESYSRIIKKIKPFLNPEGARIIFETDPKTSKGLQKIIEAQFKSSDITVEKDYNNSDRILIAQVKP